MSASTTRLSRKSVGRDLLRLATAVALAVLIGCGGGGGGEASDRAALSWDEGNWDKSNWQ